MRKEDLVVAVVCLVTAAVVLFQMVPHYFGDRGGPGPGAFPTYIALLLAACGISILLQYLRGNRRASEPPFMPSGTGGKRLVYLGGSLLVHRVATDVLGFSIASMLLMMFQMGTLGRHRKITVVVFSVLFVFIVSFIFREWLYMALPRGIFDL